MFISTTIYLMTIRRIYSILEETIRRKGEKHENTSITTWGADWYNMRKA